MIFLFILFLLYCHSAQKFRTPKQELDGAEKQVDFTERVIERKTCGFYEFSIPNEGQKH